MVIHLHAVRACPNQDVVLVLTQLLEEAKAGKITGLAYAVIEQGSRYSADVVGRAKTSPLIALGIARALEETVARLIG